MNDTGAASIPHFVNRGPFSLDTEGSLTPEQERYYLASQWKLMWWRFTRHKLAVASGIFLALLYISILFCEMLAPYEAQHRDRRSIVAPPQSIHLFHEGHFVGPFVYGQRLARDPVTLRAIYTPDTTKVQPIRFFCLGGYDGA